MAMKGFLEVERDGLLELSNKSRVSADLAVETRMSDLHTETERSL